MKSSIVLFIYKRSDNLDIILSALRRAHPRELFIVADGPKGSREKDLVLVARAKLESLIDWPCKIRKKYA
ncbi:MAG: glycosyltransferase family 2 protein, partial [Candidatus Magasanikbacteria bacterium]|nr:glycosyltransferase family 2 protein [Candidatus Magasanikbacteria bacterium]